MPIYEYVCDDCGARYERIVMSKSAEINCPKCASSRHTLQLSVFRTTGNSSSSNGKDFASLGGCGCTPKSCRCH